MNFKSLAARVFRRLSLPLPDKLYIKTQYRLEMGRPLNLDDCRTMNEKLQWLKLYNRKPELTSLVDKIDVKAIVAERIGSEHIIPTLAIWDSPDEISFDNLPDKFVIKTNHSGGNTGVVVCDDKSKADLADIRSRMAASLKDDIYRTYREWPYKDVRKRIFAEAYLGDNLTDYKFYCFNGNVDSVMLCIGRQEGKTRFYFFDRKWNLRRYNKAGKQAPIGFTLPKPEGMAEMFDIAARLSEGFPFVRVDLYNIDGRIYFGELTFYPASGYDPNRLPETDLYFGSMIKLPSAKTT